MSYLRRQRSNQALTTDKKLRISLNRQAASGAGKV